MAEGHPQQQQQQQPEQPPTALQDAWGPAAAAAAAASLREDLLQCLPPLSPGASDRLLVRLVEGLGPPLADAGSGPEHYNPAPPPTLAGQAYAQNSEPHGAASHAYDHLSVGPSSSAPHPLGATAPSLLPLHGSWGPGLSTGLPVLHSAPVPLPFGTLGTARGPPSLPMLARSAPASLSLPQPRTLVLDGLPPMDPPSVHPQHVPHQQQQALAYSFSNLGADHMSLPPGGDPPWPG